MGFLLISGEGLLLKPIVIRATEENKMFLNRHIGFPVWDFTTYFGDFEQVI